MRVKEETAYQKLGRVQSSGGSWAFGRVAQESSSDNRKIPVDVDRLIEQHDGI